MDTLSTKRKIITVFGCKGIVTHVVPGITILKGKGGYICPQCNSPVEDITDTPLGREYFRWVRPDLLSPPPLRSRQ